MFNLGALASVLDSIDSAAKESFEEHQVSATTIRSRRKNDQSASDLTAGDALAAQNANEDLPRSAEVQSNHSGRTQESYVVPSPPHSEVISVHDSEDAKEPAVTVGVTASTQSAKLLPNEVEELRQLLRKKSKDIEKLNREVLEFEEHCNSLKDEVQEAWNQYKQAQEKAAFREAELMDEIKQIQKSKLVDKQQSVAQMSKLGDEVAMLTKQLQAYQAEKADLLQQIGTFDAVHLQWEERVATLEAELQEAKAHTIQGAHNLREELKAAQATADQMRTDYTLLLKQNQARQSALEAENTSLTKAIADREREIQRLQYDANGGAGAGLAAVSHTEYEHLQRELLTTSTSLMEEQEKNAQHELREKQLEKDFKALQILYGEEKKRNSDSYNKLLARTQELEKAHAMRLAEAARAEAAQDDQGAGKDSKELAELRQQVHHLSQLLLKRQATILDMQAERSALNSKVAELEVRSVHAEQRIREMDEEGEGEGEGYAVALEEGHALAATGFRSGSGLLSNRKGLYGKGRVGGDSPAQTQLLSDLEKYGVKPNAGVSRAVNLIDTYALITGKFLRNYPLVRLGFVFYLLVLHLWVLFILMLHTNSLDLEDSPQEYIRNNQQ